jgi:hypothetical protein
MFNIEKNVLIPAPKNRIGVAKYPFAKMVEGDSFGVPVPPEATDEDSKKVAFRVQRAAYAFMKKYGGKFAIRNLQNEVRVWCKKNPEV